MLHSVDRISEFSIAFDIYKQNGFIFIKIGPKIATLVTIYN